LEKGYGEEEIVNCGFVGLWSEEFVGLRSEEFDKEVEEEDG